ncbi:DUF4139 domain-containing protein [Hydrogenimonas sp.]
MKKIGSIVAALVLSSSAWGATLSLYRDGAVYRFTPKEGFVGFVGKGAEARCGERVAALVQSSDCPESSRLCREWQAIEGLHTRADTARSSAWALKALLSRVRLDRLDAADLVRQSAAVGEKLSSLKEQERRLRAERERRKSRFLTYAPVFTPVFVQGCEGEIELRLPRGAIDFRVAYEADVSALPTLAVTQYLTLRNRSGLDIEAERATFHFEPMRRTLRPIRFRPWVVRDATKSAPRILTRGVAPMVADAAAPAPEMAQIDVEGPRRYEVKGLKLPASAVGMRVTLRRWEQPAESEEVAYPWRDTRVYKTVTFKPRYAIDANDWRAVRGGRLLSTRVFGAYGPEGYRLFVDVDEEVTIRREHLVLKEKESFFGSKIHKKDGYRLELFNQSDKKKRIHIVERLPVAVRSDVEVKLLKVETKLPLRYERGEEGRLDLFVTLPPKSGGEVRVLFEVRYDKKKPVAY